MIYPDHEAILKTLYGSVQWKVDCTDRAEFGMLGGLTMGVSADALEAHRAPQAAMEENDTNNNKENEKTD